MYVFESVINQIAEGNAHIAGIMLESHLYEGTQEISFPLRYGVSITDPCLGWDTDREANLGCLLPSSQPGMLYC